MGQRICSVDGCDKPMKAKSWCGMHYAVARRTGDPASPTRNYPRRDFSTCTIDGCTALGDAGRGWCSKHYRRWQRHGDPLATSRIVGDDDARFRSHIEISPNGCWLWTASHNQDGYAIFSIGGVPCSGHRWSWERQYGPVPDGMELDHLCRVRRCVNPAHLEPVPHKVNVLRGESFAAVNAAKMTCPRGHRYTRNPTNGRRECKLCARENETKRLRLSVA